MLRVLARPLLATWFVYAGVQSVLEPQVRAARSAPVIEPALKEVGLDDVKTTDLVKYHGMATIASASVLALSRTPRTAGLVLAGLTAATVAVSRPFWLETDEQRKEEQLELFLKNVSLFGGTLLAATVGHSPRKIKRTKAKKAKKAKVQAKKDKLTGASVTAKKK
ncbi:hypothetical protein ACNI3K_05145 [Demequina sp. SO4-13]|uniref:hypothetical protein n=1 Tax=Demequina sp. SO4-13 TaxID=3401027 RepID=UPI003AF4FC8C